MLRTPRQILAVSALAALLAACATTPPGPTFPGPSGRPSAGTGGYKVGKPYQIEGTWYYPKEQPDYDETGVASWYGPNFYGKATANGEPFDGDGLTAAHRTLPMPSNVRVTNLDNGKSVVVRVNDRGPYARGRIIDVSPRVAQLLGFYANGTAKVRVQYVGPAERPSGGFHEDTPTLLAHALPPAPTGRAETASLRVPEGALAAPPVEAVPLPSPAVRDSAPDVAATQPTGHVTTVPVPAETHLYVQAGAFSSYQNASRLRQRLADAGEFSISSMNHEGQTLYRVRLGPYDDLEAANVALANLQSLGNNDAAIVVDR
ncbi:MAG TPA: septal ring lytic transglycosylase RlpA family protein [Rhizomicrobium sp.]